MKLEIVCGRVQAAYGANVGLFDRLREILVLDFSESSKMRRIFQNLLAEQRAPGPGTQLMMTALMSECLVRLLRRLGTSAEQAPEWLRALEDPDLAEVIDAILTRPDHSHSVASLAAIPVRAARSSPNGSARASVRARWPSSGRLVSDMQRTSSGVGRISRSSASPGVWASAEAISRIRSRGSSASPRANTARRPHGGGKK